MSSKTADAFLLRASGSGDLAVAEIALKSGANVNCSDQFGRRPILNASQRCDHAMVALLMKRGANPRCLGSDGMYPMALAAVMDRVDILDALGSHCWDVESPSEMVPSALENALEAGRHQAARHLVGHGAQVQTIGRHDDSLLMQACLCGNVNATRFLAEEGALWFAVDASGFNAIDYAMRMRHHALMPVLHYLARNEPLINPRRFFPQGLHARPHLTHKDLMDVEVEKQELNVQKIRSMIERRISAFRLEIKNDKNGKASGDALNLADTIDGVDGVDGDDGDNFWLEMTEPLTQVYPHLRAGAVSRLWSSSTLKMSAGLRALKNGFTSLVDDAQIGISFLSHATANAFEHVRWLKPERWASLRRTARFIAALHAADLMRARTEQLNGQILPNARDHNGSPLTVLVVRALNKTPHSSVLSVLGGTKDDPNELAFRILRSLALDGARAHSFDAVSGTGVGHAFMEGNFASVYFRLLDERFYCNTLNRSNMKMERPLHIAVRRRNADAINGLLARGCDRNPVNRDGHSPLHHCALNSDSQIAEILIASGANAKLNTRRGQGIETMLKGMTQRIETFTALLEARKGIEQVMSIFSPGNPMASVVRGQERSSQPLPSTTKKIQRKDKGGQPGRTDPAEPSGA